VVSPYDGVKWITNLRENRQSLINFIGYNVIVNTDDNNTREGKGNP
jgi:hypothetical protein